MKTIVLDVDGVLANFTKPFSTIGNRFFGTAIIEEGEQRSWGFRDELSVAQQNVMWEWLKNYSEWWNSLPPLINHEAFARINRLTMRNEVYFLTNRFSYCRPPGEQTMSWLIRYGIDNPRVIISGKKGEVCRAVKADFSLEDNWSNACAIHWMAEGCQSFLIERHQNEKAREIIPKGIMTVKTVDGFLSILEGLL